MYTRAIWTTAVAASAVVAVAAYAYFLSSTAIESHKFDLSITAYLECLTKYQVAKASGRLPGEAPSGAEVCGKYK